MHKRLQAHPPVGELAVAHAEQHRVVTANVHEQRAARNDRRLEVVVLDHRQSWPGGGDGEGDDEQAGRPGADGGEAAAICTG